MLNSKIYNIFDSLKNTHIDCDQYIVDSFDSKLPHKLGCSKEKNPVFFIHCDDDSKVADIKLTLFTVMHNRQCSVYDKVSGDNLVLKYSVIQLNSDDEEFQKYFLDVILLLLLKLPSKPTVSELDANIKRIITLFTNAKQPSKEAIRGLFAELMTIDLSKNPHYMLKSWHVTPRDTFDFNDGIDKVEVKSYTGEIRKYTFSLDQLCKVNKSQLVVVSMAVIQTGLGMNIYELMDRISLKVQDDINLLIHLRDIVTSTVGKYFNEVSEYRFDYSLSTESYVVFDVKDIPTISKDSVPFQVSNVHFSVDFSSIDPIIEKKYNSNLINSLF